MVSNVCLMYSLISFGDVLWFVRLSLYCTLYSWFCPSPRTLVKTLAKNLVKNLAQKSIKKLFRK